MDFNRKFYVKVLLQHSIFCNLPTVLCKQLSTKDWVVVKLSSNNDEFYVMWNGGCSSGEIIEVPASTLSSNHTKNSKDGMLYNVTIIHNVSVASDVMLKPISSFDWDIISTQAGYIEENMLKEHGILYNDQVVQIRVGKNLTANLQIQHISSKQDENINVARINNTTSLIIEPYRTTMKDNNADMKNSTISCSDEIQKLLEHSEHEKVSHLQVLHVLPHAHYGTDTSFQLPIDNTTMDTTTTEGVQLDDSYLDTFLDDTTLKSTNNANSTIECFNSLYAPLHSIQSEETSICLIHPLFYLRCFEQVLGHRVSHIQWSIILENLQKSPSIACIEQRSSRDSGNTPLTSHAIVNVVMNTHVRPGCCIIPTSVRKGLLLQDYDQVRLYLVNSLLGGTALPHRITIRRVCWNPKPIENRAAVSLTTSTTTESTDKATLVQVADHLHRNMVSCHRAGLPFILYDQQVLSIATPTPCTEKGLLEGIHFDSHDYIVALEAGNSVKRHGLPANLVLPPSPTASAIWATCLEVLTVQSQHTSLKDDAPTTTPTPSAASITADSTTSKKDYVTGSIDPILLELLNTTSSSSECSPNRHILQSKSSFRRPNGVYASMKLSEALFKATVRSVMKSILPVLLPRAVYDCLLRDHINDISSCSTSNSVNNSNECNNSSSSSSSRNSNIYPCCGSLLTGATGTGRTTLLLDIGEFVQNNIHTQTYVQYINTAELRNKSIETILSKLTEVFSIAEQYPSNLILLDNLDVLCPSSRETGMGSLRDEKTSIVSLHLEILLQKVHQQHNKRLTQAGTISFDSMNTTPYLLEECIYQAVEHSVYILATAETYTNVSPCLLQIHCLRTIQSIETLTERNKIRALVTALGAYDLSVPDFSIIDCDRLTAAMQGYRIYDIRTLAKTIYSTVLRQSLLSYNTNRIETSIKQKNSNTLSVSIDHILLAASEYICISNTTSTTSSTNTIKSSYNTKLTLADIPGYKEEKRQIFDTLQTPLIYARLYQKCPIKLPRSILLYGPSGCGKTLLALTIGNKFHHNFISIRGPELLNKYIGASEKAIRDLFQRARDSGRSCLIFFDEFESLAPKRGKDNTGVTDRIVNQLLTFIDGVETHMSSNSGSSNKDKNNKLPSSAGNTTTTTTTQTDDDEEEELSSTGQIFIIAATSRPDLIDPALLRPGRIEKHIYIGLPNSQDRAAIVLEYINKLPSSTTNNMIQELKDTIDIIVVHEKAAFFSPADWRAVVNTAYLGAVHDYIQQLSVQQQLEVSEELHTTTSNSSDSCSSSSSNICITSKQLLQAFHTTKASISGEDLTHLSAVYRRFNPKTPLHPTHTSTSNIHKHKHTTSTSTTTTGNTSTTSSTATTTTSTTTAAVDIDNATNKYHLNDSELKLAYY